MSGDRGPGDWSPLDHEVLRQVLDGTPAGVSILDARLRYVYVNPALARMNGVSAAAHVGRTITEVLPDLDDTGEDTMQQVLADGTSREVPSSGHTRAPSGLTRRYWQGAYHRLSGPDGTAVGLVGITLEVSSSRHEQHELERARERLALLDRAATLIGTTLEMEATCSELARFLVPLLADIASVDVLPPEGTTAHTRGLLRLRRAAMAALPNLRDQVRIFGEPGQYLDYQEGSTIPRCLQSGRPVLEDLCHDGALARSASGLERIAAYRAAGIHSALVVPLTARGHPIGTVSMVRGGESPAFTERDVEIAQDVVGRAAISLDNARRYTHEHGITLELQRALMSEPGSPHPTVEAAFRYQPAGSSALVGGDWYDTVRLSFGRTLLAMGDVMGHGVEASVDMSQYRSMLRFVAGADLPPHRILRRLDTLISETESGRPASCLLALVDPTRGKCAYSSAGHLPPAMIRPDGSVELVEVPVGPPLGTGHGGYEIVSGACGRGDVLLLYTDGLVERRGEDIDVSLDRLARLRLHPDGDLGGLVDRILSLLVCEPADDDIAVLAARIVR
ncbi:MULTISPECIES: SpoIIE family protein phosphatase [unclassified Streptomyces]|uniref:SpoIIE family protein phosphatase n=1 Tax=unclassified Streptomyces TaxID=2593676 RepID=UPI00380CAAC5